MKFYMDATDKSFGNYEKFYANFLKYEDVAVDFYADGELSQRSITHPGAAEVRESINPTIKEWKNPYREAYIWIKGELLDLLGARDAMDGRDTVVTKQNELEAKKKEKQTELEKMSLGKTTMKSFFKSKSTIEKDIVAYQQEVERIAQEIEDYRKLINFITIYHGHMAIDKFKQNKIGQYLRMLNNFAVREISNAHLAATLYHQLLELQERK